MAQLEHPGFCELAEYMRVFDKRLQAGDISDAAILTVYFRLERLDVAAKTPVQVEVTGKNIAGLAVDIFLVDQDLKVIRKTMCSGIIVDGVWNAHNKTDGFYYTDQRNNELYTYDGVFAEYDDGLDMRFFEEALAGAGANTMGLDLGARPLE